MSIFRTKPIEAAIDDSSSLRRCLSATDVTLMGIGAVIGAGIFVLTGIVAATSAGPAVMLSYVVSGLACVFVALSYAEFAAAIGGCGSAYGYAYAGLGELIAWIIGWDLLIEYGLGISTVAVGWSGYVSNVLSSLGISLPAVLTKGPSQGGYVDLPAVLVILCITGLLCLGARESAKFNNVIVAIKLLAIGIFIAVASSHVNTVNWQVFMPFGWNGVMGGAALVFFAYIGFDAVSTAAEETINPQRNLPIGIIASLGICTALYVVVSGLLTLIVPYTTLNVKSPVSNALLEIHSPIAAGFVAAGAIAGLTTVILVLFYGFSRIVLAISRDGLFPAGMSKLHPKTKSPVGIIVCSGLIFALVAGLTPIDELAQLVNIGTLAAFTLVCAGIIVLRKTKPDMPRPFRLPWSPVVPILGIVFCVYLMISLPMVTWIRFGVWMLIGFVIYFTYGRHHSKLNRAN